MSPESESQKFQCEICDKSYKKKDSLTRHSHNHQDSQRHICLQCSKNFRRRDTLQRHLDLHHKGRTRGVRACERCRVAKVRCDSQTPCSRCAKAYQDCTYSTPATNGGTTNGVYVATSTRSELSSQRHHSTNVDQRAGTPPSFGAASPGGLPTETDHQNQNRTLIVDDFAILDLTQVNASMDGGNAISGDRQHGLESDPADVTMTNTMNPLHWDQEGLLSWSSTDLFLNDNFIVDTDLYANNPVLMNSTDNAIFEFDDNVTGTARISAVNGPLLGDLRSDSDKSLTSVTGLSDFNIRSTAYTTISSLDRLVRSRGRSGSPEYLRYPSQPIAERELRVQDTDGPNTRPILEDIVKEMIQVAIQNLTSSGTILPHFPERSREFSTRITALLPEAESIPRRSSSPHLLHHFCGQFMAHFNPLWPLIRPNGLDLDSTLPVLYLTIASIGAMYSGPGSSQLGLMIHKNLRLALLTTPLLHQQSSYSLECLQSLLLTEISTLYFGPRSALPIAQRIGAMIVLQARAMGIFSGRAFWKYNNVVPTLEQWSHREATIRVAFGSFRAEIFVSALLNTRPLISAEEINLDLPCSDKLWVGSVDDQRASLEVRDQTSLIYSDLVRIAMDRSEIMPDLGIAHRELVLYGVQESTWRFSHDPELFSRTMGKSNIDHILLLDDSADGELFTRPTRRQSLDRTVEDWAPVSSSTPSVEIPMQDHLDCSSRKMADLRLDYSRMMIFLREWKTSFVSNQSSSQLEGSRYNLLNSRLLYHLSFLRLRSDLHTLDSLTDESDDFQHAQLEDAVLSVWQWSKTVSAEKALQHACAIWVLVSSESTWKVGSRARFNILCLIALHCASKVVWAYAGTHTNPQRGILKMPAASTEFLGTDLPIFRENSHSLMECFSRLFNVITKGWVSWFPGVVARMAESPLPLLHGSEVDSLESAEQRIHS